MHETGASIIPLLMLLGAIGCSTPNWAADAFGVWSAKSLTVRIEPHVKGEVLTMDTVYGDGHVTTSSTILYLDGKPREFEDLKCSGTQSSRRVDSRTVEILRNCAEGGWVRFVRRLSGRPKSLVLDITEQHDGHRSERRLVLEKQ